MIEQCEASMPEENSATELVAQHDAFERAAEVLSAEFLHLISGGSRAMPGYRYEARLALIKDLSDLWRCP
jgi:hypothetical protein